MTNTDAQADPTDGVWRSALDTADALTRAGIYLTGTRQPLRRRLREALRGAGHDRNNAMTLLGSLGHELTVDLVPEVVAVALSHRDALEARQLLGRLPASLAAQVVPPAVTAQLEEAPDDDAYRRMAELLDHLGLADALESLCDTAAASDDPEIREVGADFRRWSNRHQPPTTSPVEGQ
jgi:hypothetical protein